MWVGAMLLFFTLMLVAERMARARRRSIKGWVWFAAIVGPIGPLALYLLGRKRDALHP
jgi:hypothetical protein